MFVQIVFLFLILPKKIMKSQLLIFFVSLFLGNLFKIYQCNPKTLNDLLSVSTKLWGKTASIWCWFVAFSPLINFIVFKYT
uniref:Uncharacterized protein n=1 Tax=viral metagenome TaxID=1070528 RepID=A0A6C0J929_9ZZZZ